VYAQKWSKINIFPDYKSYEFTDKRNIFFFHFSFQNLTMADSDEEIGKKFRNKISNVQTCIQPNALTVMLLLW
jgi:hypothetical protein